MIKIKQYIGVKILGILLLLQMGCKQETLIGEKATGNEPYKIYFLNATGKGLINGLAATGMTVDITDKTAAFPISVFRGGQAGSEPVTVKVTADNSLIQSLIQSGDLPANTVVPDAGTYSFNEEITLSVDHDMMKGSLLPKIKIPGLGQYGGKTIALGFKIASASRYTINETMDKVVLFVNVDELAGPIRFVASAQKNNGIVNALQTSFTVNNTDNTVSIPMAISRSGTADLGSFTVDAVTDNSMINGMKASGELPANTIILSAADYTLDTKVALTKSSDGVTGNAHPKIKIGNLNQYSGKKAVLGVKLTNPSEFSIDAGRDKAVLYFDVDSLLDETVPPANLLTNSGWVNLKINNDNNVIFTINADGSIKATGGNWGHAGVYQAVQVKAGRKYKIDMHVKGSGATDVWYEVYVGTVAPAQGSDYSNGGVKLALNTWTGCGKSAFDGQLSQIACVSSNGGVFTAAATGTMYVVIKSGGANLGTDGITASNIDFRRVP